MVDAAAAVDTAALCGEVGVVVSKVRSRRELAAQDLPCIDMLAADAGCDREQLLAGAIELVDDDAYRRFLRMLLPFPLPDAGRWPPLGRRHISDEETGRGVRAGFEVFGISSWDGLNARTEELGGRSRREIAEEQLARAVGRRAGGERAGELVDPVGTQLRPSRPRVGRAIAAGAVGIAAVIALVAVLLVNSGDEASSDEEVGATDVAGAECVAVGKAAALREPWSPEAAAAALNSAARHAPGGRVCAVAEARSWDDLVVQEVDDASAPIPGALVANPDGTSVYLPPAAYAGYHQIGGKEGDAAQVIAGYPIEVVTTPDGHVEVPFTKGVLMVGADMDSPFFWLLAPFVDWWRAHPELGLPTGNPMTDLSQDFQHGWAHLDPTLASGTPVAELAANREQALPEVRGERILRQGDATAWWVDAKDQRHWIPDGATWECLGGDAVVAGRSVPGWALAALPEADIATCPGG